MRESERVPAGGRARRRHAAAIALAVVALVTGRPGMASLAAANAALLNQRVEIAAAPLTGGYTAGIALFGGGGAAAAGIHQFPNPPYVTAGAGGTLACMGIQRGEESIVGGCTDTLGWFLGRGDLLDSLDPSSMPTFVMDPLLDRAIATFDLEGWRVRLELTGTGERGITSEPIGGATEVGHRVRVTRNASVDAASHIIAPDGDTLSFVEHQPASLSENVVSGVAFVPT